MKKAFIGLLILILSAWAQYVFSAEPIQLARMNGYVAAGVGAASCSNAASDYVGDKTKYTEAANYTQYDMYCYLYTSPTMTCDTGTFGYAYVRGYVVDGGTKAITICVYLDDNDGVPGTGDTKVGCATSSMTGSTAWYKSSGEIGGTITKTSDYWVCALDRNNTAYSIYRTSTGSRTVYYKLNDSDPGEPNTLMSMSTTADRDASIYVEVK
jgi:hypothetical protein